MSDLPDLYQELILDHNRKPRNRRKLEFPDREAEGYNPLCGDRVKVFLQIVDGVVKDATFEGSGCAISTASASLMTESVKGKSVDEARALFKKFHDFVTGETKEPKVAESLGKLAAFAGVSLFPARVKCATLPWHTINAALEDIGQVISTE